MENAALKMTVSELFIYRSLNKDSRRFLCYFACLCIILHNLEQRIIFAQQIQFKAKLVEHRYEK